MKAATFLTTGAGEAAARPFDATLSRDLEDIDIALQANPPRHERIWLRLAKRVLESRMPETGVR